MATHLSDSNLTKRTSDVSHSLLLKSVSLFIFRSSDNTLLYSMSQWYPDQILLVLDLGILFVPMKIYSLLKDCPSGSMNNFRGQATIIWTS
jgi:hypothetical protein